MRSQCEVPHEGIDVGRRSLGAEVHVIGVLVHVEREHGAPPASLWAWSARPLDDEPVEPLRPGRAASNPSRRPGPWRKAVNSDRQRSTEPKSRSSAVARPPAGLAGSAEPVEIDFVQDHGVGGDQLLAPETVDFKNRRRRPNQAR